ncbi:hypothetical protein L1889_06705 [Paenalcaligenes niemegkensis]|uniref:hypothetical protein n=1 Tax=Paenalcaligenes niemegkensis TaxID=2895469 RepID=UPI001EE97D76|nr:hypothetical protein [Paenalcaligenes niemegkensis]MCQ9616436.1 hypothetical protein [Paenalcaligenes niemegkensis]
MLALGPIFIIVGVIIAVASPLAAFWWAHIECALEEAGGTAETEPWRCLLM